MRVLLVGASGAVGRQLLPQLVGAGHQVTATSHSSSTTGTTTGIDHRRLDLLDGDAVSALVEEVRPDVIIHQATALSRLGNNLRRFDAAFAVTNRLRTGGTASLIRAAQGNGMPRIIVQGFCGWPWGQIGGPVKNEDDPLDANPPKAFRRTFDALRELETMVTGYPEGVVLRYGALYGLGTSLGPGGAQIESMRRGRLPLVGDGGGIWSFVHVADAASAAVAAVDRGRGIYSIVDDHPAAVREWLPEVARLAGGPPPRRVPVWLARLVGGEGLMRMMTTVRGSANGKARVELAWAPRWTHWRDGFAAELAETALTVTDRRPTIA